MEMLRDSGGQSRHCRKWRCLELRCLSSGRARRGWVMCPAATAPGRGVQSLLQAEQLQLPHWNGLRSLVMLQVPHTGCSPCPVQSQSSPGNQKWKKVNLPWVINWGKIKTDYLRWNSQGFQNSTVHSLVGLMIFCVVTKSCIKKG